MKRQNNKNKHKYMVHATGIAGILILLLLRLFVKQPATTWHTEWAHEISDTIFHNNSSQTIAPLPKKNTLPVRDIHKRAKADSSAVPVKTESYRPHTPLKIELNTADSLDLLSLYGIGPYYAQKILEYRKRLGGFAIPEQLLEIKGFDKERLDGFSDKVFADSTLILKTDLKTATEAQLANHLYIGKYLARCIILYREVSHPDSCSIHHLVEHGILTKEQARRISWYLH